MITKIYNSSFEKRQREREGLLSAEIHEDFKMQRLD
jgi:hypothetical protein